MKYPRLNRRLIRQRGTILIVALFIMALLEITVAALVINHRIEIRYANNYLSSQAALAIALGGEAWAKAEIVKKFINEKNLDEAVLNKKTISGGFVEGNVIDIQGHFNLNNLSNAEQFDGFKNMIKAIEPDFGSQADRIIELVQKRMVAITGKGEERPYPLATVTQIRPIASMTTRTFNKLLPHLFVLPAITPLNVNTATEYSLMSLSPKITKDLAKSIIKLRESMNGFTQVEAFMALPPVQGINIDVEKIAVISQFYLSSITVNYNGIDLTLYSLIRVMNVGKDVKTFVYWRSFGTI